MERIRCSVERITFQNEENGFTVLKVRAKQYSALITVVGSMASVAVGSILTVAGEWKNDSKHGRQFIAASWEETLPATVSGIERYLGSGLIKGVGPKFAKRIVAQFGADTLTVMEDSPDRLIEVTGIGSRRVSMIKKAWLDQKEIKNIVLFLQAHQVSTTHAARIYKAYGNESVNVVKENPYKLADNIWGIGFKTADTIAMKMGFDKESYYRCRSGLFFVLSELSGEGHCFLQRAPLMEKASQMLEIEETKLSMTLDHMLKEKDLVREDPDRIYLLPFFHSERGVAKRLHTILSTEQTSLAIDIEGIIAAVERRAGMSYDEIQKDAIRKAVASKVMILTGGPGTGKTTTTTAIIAAFREQGKSVLLAAPTGRAAKRLSEATGLEAKTLHRLLECKPPEGYKRNEDNPLEGDTLIVDESSMIDIVLMYNLLKAVPDSMTVIFVGDADQLPSVGAGNVLRDMMDSGVIRVVKLERIYRQAQASQIILNAHRINHGEYPVLRNGRDSDFFFIEENVPDKLPALICELCCRRLPKHYRVNPISGIQVLSPMQRGETGAANLNRVLQQAQNPHGVGLSRGGTEYRFGDKVMQIKNNYEKEVFNGDIGIVTAVDTEDRTVSVTFDRDPVAYDISELDELVLAYATTIHKAQGSEYPIVVMPFTMQHYVMLQRNLLYTGVTRARKALVLVGMKKAVGYAVRNNAVVNRNTGLAERLQSIVIPSPL